MARPRNVARRLVRGLVGVVVVAVVVVGGAGVASAHASLVSTNPVDGQSVPAAPDQVSATFSEPVSVEVGGLSVRNRAGDQVQEGDSSVDSTGRTVTVDLRGGLPDGTYVATYRVLSADGHPVNGSFVFGIGSGPVDLGASAGVGSGDTGWEAAGAVARFVTYLSALLAAGVAFFLAFLHDQRVDRWKLVPVVRVGAVLGLVGVAATIAVQAALLTGEGLRAATDTDVLRSVLDDRLGWSAAVLLIGLALVHLSTDTNRLLAAQVLASSGGLAVIGSFALWGHDTEAPSRWLAVGADVVHVAAAALWLGGLVGLAMVLRRRAPHPVGSTAGIVGRFSTAAAVSAATIVVAGGAMAWIESGSLHALVSTTYGRLVLVKLAITLAVLAMAAVNRFRLVPAIIAHAADAPDEPDLEVVTVAASSASGPDAGAPVPVRVPDADGDSDDAGPTESEEQAWRWVELRRLVTYEALALVAVLAFTSVLVNVTPARNAVVSGTEVVNLTTETDTGTVNLVVAPATAGRNAIHVQYSDAAGRPVDVATTLTIELSLPEEDLGPISRSVVKAGPGHFVLDGDELSFPGDWTVVLRARTGDFSESVATFTVPVAR